MSRNNRVAWVRPRMPQSPVRACKKVGACRLAKHPGLGCLHLTSFARSSASAHLQFPITLFISFCPSLLRSAVFFLLSHISRLNFASCSCLFPKHAQRPAPAFSTFQLAAPPDYAADSHRERLLLGHRPKTLLDYPSVSSLTSLTHSLPTSTNIIAGHIQHIQLDRDSYPGLEPLKA